MAMSRIPLQAIISDGALTKHLLDKANPFIGLSLKIWKQTQKLCNIQKTAKLLKWCAIDSDFPPNLSDERFKTWAKKWCHCLLYSDTKGVTEELPDYEGRVWS